MNNGVYKNTLNIDIYPQIRLLMAKGEGQKTEEDRAKEEKLIARLMELVGQRNEVRVIRSVEDFQLQNCYNFWWPNFSAFKSEIHHEST